MPSLSPSLFSFEVNFISKNKNFGPFYLEDWTFLYYCCITEYWTEWTRMDRTDRTDNTEVLVIRKERIKRFPGLHMAVIVCYRDEVLVLTADWECQSYRKSNTPEVDWLVKILTGGYWPCPPQSQCWSEEKMHKGEISQLTSQSSELHYKLQANIETLKSDKDGLLESINYSVLATVPPPGLRGSRD